MKLLSISLLGVSLLAGCNSSSKNPPDFPQKIVSGLSRSEVEKSLIEAGFDYSYNPADRTIQAISRGGADFMGVSKSIVFKVQFDQSERAIQVNKDYVYTGP